MGQNNGADKIALIRTLLELDAIDENELFSDVFQEERKQYDELQKLKQAVIEEENKIGVFQNGARQPKKSNTGLRIGSYKFKSR